MRKAARKQKKLDKLREAENQKVEIDKNIIAAQDMKELRVGLSKEADGSLQGQLLYFPAKNIRLFAESLLTNTTLEHLQLDCNINLVQQVTEALKINTSVKSLVLLKQYTGYNDISIDYIFPSLGSLLQHTTSLTNLQLPAAFKYSTSDEIGDFINGLNNNRSLTTINIPAYHYRLDHMSAFLEAIENHPNHPQIRLATRWNVVSTEGMKSVALLLDKNLMKEFILDHRQYTLTDDMVPFFEALKRNTSLTQFSYISNALRKKECEVLAEALIVNKHLTQLNLQGSKIGSESMSIILDSLHHNTTVSDFKFWDTKLDNNISPALGRLIQFNETLTEIDLPRSQINHEGCKFIGPALRDNRSLTELRLIMNPIGSEGVKHLCEGLKWNKALIRVNLSDCKIDDIGCEYIGEAIKTNQCLLHLDISGTPIKEKGYRALIDGMKENQSLTDLTLSKDRTVSDDVHEEIYKAQNKNKEYQRQLKVKTITMLIQIARSDAFYMFPLEIWLRIFKHFVCGGVPGFNHIAETILMNSDVRDLSSLCKMKIVRINGKSNLVPSIAKK